MKLLAAFLCTLALYARAEVSVTVGDVSDRRTTGKFFTGLELDLKVSGPELADCKGARLILKDAKDDTGKAVAAKKGGFSDNSFKTLQKPFGGFGKSKAKEDEYSLKLELENPLRTAKNLTVEATLELLAPSKDPSSVISETVPAEADKLLTQEALKAAGVTITLKAPKNDEVSYTLIDPNSKVASIEFCTADGKPLETNGSMSSKILGTKSVSLTLRAKPPAGMVAKIYLLTDKSVLSIPLKLPVVTLP
jgi:hypothetical protein